MLADGNHTLDTLALSELAETFRILSDPTRLGIIALLVEGEQNVQTLAETLQMSQSAISHQLRSLRERRLVRFRKEGRNVIYALDDAHVRALFEQGWAHVNHG